MAHQWKDRPSGGDGRSNATIGLEYETVTTQDYQQGDREISCDITVEVRRMRTDMTVDDLAREMTIDLGLRYGAEDLTVTITEVE